MKEIKIEKGKADCSIFQLIYLSSIANKFAICMRINMKKIHAIMFHHFYNETHVKGQGAISADELDNMLIYYKQSYNMLSADEFLEKAINNKFNESDVCLTFDDSLKCQFDIALPVLEKHNLTAFWFIHTRPLIKRYDELEIYRYFRTVYFEDIEDFYAMFFNIVKTKHPMAEIKLLGFDVDKHMVGHDFYTENDKRFRFLRNDVLCQEDYISIMNDMMEERSFDYKKVVNELWMSKNELTYLHKKGHIIGLHTHTHPTTLCKQSYEQQKNEYSTNKEILEDIIKSKIISVSYPCNSYSEETIHIMKELGIKIGFRANIENGYYSILDISREDHTNIIKKMKKR